MKKRYDLNKNKAYIIYNDTTIELPISTNTLKNIDWEDEELKKIDNSFHNWLSKEINDDYYNQLVINEEKLKEEIELKNNELKNIKQKISEYKKNRDNPTLEVIENYKTLKTLGWTNTKITYAFGIGRKILDKLENYNLDNNM